ncbi:iron-sulfur cluster assembly scaffold protein, partial [Chloroflexota bacterium]
MTQNDEATKTLIEQMKQIYTDKVVDHAINSRNRGNIPQADAYAKVTGPCGDTIQMWFKVTGEKIFRATFEPDGCATTIACGSMATELITGRNVMEAAKIS